MDRARLLPRSNSTATAAATYYQHPQHSPPTAAPITTFASTGHLRREVTSASVPGANLSTPLRDGCSRETWREFLQSTSERPRHRQPPPSHAIPPVNAPSKPELPRQESDLESLAGTTSSTSGRKRVYSRAEELPGKRRPMAGNYSQGQHTPLRGSASHPIDLTSSPDSPSRQSQTNVFGRQSSRGGISLPRWQPDEEVSNCPICATAFGFLYRRHHCRKCGKVVCANCSPHRITIPRQFIVHPPPSASSSTFVTLSGIDITSVGASSGGPRTSGGTDVDPTANLSGGDVVRVCNPCVPDPNYSPPPQQLANPLTPRSQLRYHAAPERPSGHSVPRPLRRPSNTLPHFTNSSPNNENQTTGYRQRGASTNDAFIHPRLDSLNNPLPNLPSQHSHRPSASISNSQDTHDAHHSQPFPPYLPGNSHRRVTISGPRHDISTQPRFARPQPPRPQLAEEDECPVCGRELPPYGPRRDDSARVSHVENCISTYSASSSQAAVGSAPASNSIDMASTSEPTTSSSAAVGPSGRMLVYRASEKDCVGTNGEELECVICLEEFTIGEELGRLECLCKFHRHCIRDWWSRKGVGSCPTHQVSNL